MNRLYPLKFKPIIKDKIWGGTKLKTVLNKKTRNDKAGESWEISGYPGSVSQVRNGFLAGNSLEELIEVYMGDLVGDNVFEKFGTLFPLLIKFIDANDILSIQVHPDDKLALEQFGSFGKTEMWYIIQAEAGSEIIVGFNKAVTKESYLAHLNNKSLLSILNKEKTSEGDVFFISPGRIHAIDKGILLAEIQQTSDATLRIYDFDRVDDKGKPRELHTEKALEAIDFKVYPQYKTNYSKAPNQPNLLATCQYFTTNYFNLTNKVEREYTEIDSFVIYMCLKGKITLGYNTDEKEQLDTGDTVLLPAEIKKVQLLPEGEAKLLEIYIDGLPGSGNLDAILDKIF
jgi:mannose-6-phosphate isomerase